MCSVGECMTAELTKICSFAPEDGSVMYSEREKERPCEQVQKVSVCLYRSVLRFYPENCNYLVMK